MIVSVNDIAKSNYKESLYGSIDMLYHKTENIASSANKLIVLQTNHAYQKLSISHLVPTNQVSKGFRQGSFKVFTIFRNSLSLIA